MYAIRSYYESVLHSFSSYHSSLASTSALIFASGVLGAIPQPGARMSTPAEMHCFASAFTSSGVPKSRVLEGETFPINLALSPMASFAAFIV